MKITIPASKGQVLVFDDGESYALGRADPRDWYNVSVVDHRGKETELCRIDKTDIKRLAKAS